MLVLSRKKHETVRLIDRATGQLIAVIEQLELKGQASRIGIHAGPEVLVLRGEIAEQPDGGREAA